MMKPVLVSGIQPSGRLHIGNYLGALKNFVELQNSGAYQCRYFIADLHALTENPSAKDLGENIVRLAADFLAVGLNPKKSIIFQQSQIEPLQELKWIFSTLTPVSELLRMTAFKEKVLQPLKPSEREKITKERFGKIVEESNFGLAEYPVLMAADILMYDANFVPVGHDQLQHLEFARTLARKFNKKFGKTFVEPQPLLTKTPRVMSLKNPEKKMSKSEPAGCLFIDDSPDEMKAKIARATTDSGSEIRYDEAKKPGISNLLGIYAALSGESVPTLERKFKGKTYSEFKAKLAAAVTDHFADFRKRKKELLANSSKLKAILTSGSQKAAKIANKKITDVKKKVGVAL
jgi:tryptophanyl-tRNA synthetase